MPVPSQDRLLPECGLHSNPCQPPAELCLLLLLLCLLLLLLLLPPLVLPMGSPQK